MFKFLSYLITIKCSEIKKKCFDRASLKSSDYYWPEPEPVALGAMGQVSTLMEQYKYPYGSIYTGRAMCHGPRASSNHYSLVRSF